MDILLIASKLSYFSDHNIYVDDEEKLEILNKYNPGLINNYINNNTKKKYTTIIDNYNEIEKNKLLNEISDVDNSDSTDLTNKISNIIFKSVYSKTEEGSNSVINVISDNKLKNSLAEDISLKRGCIKEDYNIDLYEKKYNVNITNRNKYYIKKLLSFDYNNKKINIIVCGKIDGIINDVLIESKNRRKRLFKYIPIYEKVQLEIYLFLLNYKKSKLIQHYDNEIDVIDYIPDEQLFSEICNNIISYFIKMFSNNILNIDYNNKKFN
ncbi:hypothetical protein AMV240 [Betaentomopoxvirus amoorei]|uniref:AMV240 n=1 Tax=Amsacta moorei entomopoxvirus TaxID=28321 RepID=Q9EMG6_AMEPV|nr:hypothetical protein AMV240 [Amsacta moorei entomopoxvirus]AAG02946.1 AMV240 [Amsacta moorei entomopoxvirus]